jgi:hypothetical protein
MTTSERQEAFKILELYRIEAQKECKGCLSINSSYKECKFTHLGFPDIPNCPCKCCLIKCTCDAMCEDFVIQAKGCKRYIHYIYDQKINDPKKYHIKRITI